MIEIDGSYAKGGGQVLRNSLALSLATGRIFRISRIRESRPKPGLSAQHLACIRACMDLWDAKSDPVDIGTTEFTFKPGALKKRKAEIDIGTAGSITLLLQAFLLPAIYSRKSISLRIIGGTDVRWSMPIDFFTHVLIPHLGNHAKISVKLLRRGYFPKGGGIVEVKIIPKEKFHPLYNNPGQIAAIKGISHAHISLQNAAQRQADAANTILPDAEIRTEYAKTGSAGSGITLWAVMSGRDDLEPTGSIGADCLGKKGMTPEKVGEMAAYELKKNIRRNFDPNLTDNLIPFIGIFGGSTPLIEMTHHIQSGIYVTESFIGKNLEIKDLKLSLRA